MLPRRSLAALAALAVIAFAVIAVPAPRASAQQVGGVQPSGAASITTDRQVYNIGDSIQVCYRIPIAGFITPPAGHECLILAYPLAGGRGQTQTCFWVNGAPPPSGWIDAGAAQVDSGGNFNFDGR